jgi:hypothetical protein
VDLTDCNYSRPTTRYFEDRAPGDRVLTHSEDPANHQRYEDPEARCAEALGPANLLNPKQLRYRCIQGSVPPSQSS